MIESDGEANPVLISPHKIQPKDKILFLGEKQFEIDKLSSPPCYSYVQRFRDMLLAHNPGQSFEVIDRTEQGVLAHQLWEEWVDDILFHAPNWIIISVGIADAKEIAASKTDEKFNRYVSFLDRVLSQSESELDNTRIVLAEPAAPSNNKHQHGPLLQTLEQLGKATRELASKYECVFVPLQKIYLFALQHYGRECFGPDLLNPNQFGAVLKAESISRAVSPRPAPLETDQLVFQGHYPAHPSLDTAMDETETWLFIGDSITDVNRRTSINPLGVGYVRLCYELIRARKPKCCVRWVNRGICGNNISDLADRWEFDCLDHQPDRIIIKIGINDIDGTLKNEFDLGVEHFSRTYHDILERTHRALPNARLLLISPFFLSRDHLPDSFPARINAVILDYISAIENLAQEFKADFLNSHAIFQEHLQRLHYRNLGEEHYHPNPTGVMVLAEAVYEKLSCPC